MTDGDFTSFGQFQNPIVGGQGTLLRNAIKSPDYVPGVSGWSINKDGTAEFNEGKFRGAVLIGNPPSQGAVSIGLTGTDIPLALRTFSPDYTWYEADVHWFDTTQFQFSALVFNSAFSRMEQITGVRTTGGGVQLQTFVDATFPNSYYFGSSVYDTNPVDFEWRNSNITGSSDTTFNLAGGITVSGGQTFSGGAKFTGTAAEGVTITGGNSAGAGGTVDLYTGGANETWHAIPYANSWANLGGGRPGGYRRVASPPNSVEITGQFSVPAGSRGDGTTIGNLPANYRPATQVDMPAVNNSLGAAGTNTPHFNISSTGVITCWGMSTASSAALNGTFATDR